MSNGEVRKVSLQDIQLVQNLIERCLQLYMSQREVVSTLLQHAKIEPGFTELVWQKLEAENQEFFRAYHLRLVVKEQIMRFNELLEKQVQLMHQMHQTGVASIPFSNGSQIHPMNNLAYLAPQPTRPVIKSESRHQAINPMPTVFGNGGSSLQPFMQVTVSLPSHLGTIDASGNMVLAQNSNAAMMQGMNGMSIKSEGEYASDPPFIFGSDSNLLEPRSSIAEASVSPFNGGESSSTLSETMLDPEANSFGFLGQIPRNFSLSDLTADFSNSTDILENYSRSPFLGTDANFLDSHIKGEQDASRLDTISEGLSYGSD